MDKESAVREARMVKAAMQEKVAKDPHLQEIVLLRTKLEVRTWFLRVVLAVAVAEAVIIFNMVF